ncbi:MAG TPA: DUF3471 domain-containing protein, partial [Solirubrobacterales bacterium]|nr:DUF3471 domain-containing protein [Solirubrobacterales bacterium]
AETGRVERDWLAGYGPVFAAMLDNHSRLAGRTRPSDPRPAPLPRAFLGAYANPYYGPARIVRRGDKLALLLGPDPQAFHLRHWSGNTFYYYPRGENAVGISAVTIAKPRRDRTRAIEIEYLNAEGLGRFRRR